jgi:hypothetical protein
MTTLGYVDDVKITKSEIARVQLVQAIELFVSEKFLPSITLAGAAEEIFGRLIAMQSDDPVIEQAFSEIQRIRDITGLSVMGDKSKKEIFNEWNSVKNNLKHHNNSDGDFIVLNVFDEAYWMIKRALANANKLCVHIHNQNDFENWVIIHINM